MEEGQGNDKEGRPAEKKPQKKKRTGNSSAALVCWHTKKIFVQIWNKMNANESKRHLQF